MKLAAAYQSRLESFLRRSFPLWQRLGVHVVPNHFYQPIPDTRTLREDLWRNRSELGGINFNDGRQTELLALFRERYAAEYENFPREKTSAPQQYYTNNGAFESVDGEILYCMIRHFKPRRIFEIGSGNSTYLSAQAALKNTEEDGRECRLTAFEPYPNEVLRAGFPGLSELVERKVQDVPAEKFEELEAGDILFIDSSHVLKIGSDVQYEYLEILPRLRPGVIVHVHDIFLPAEYPREWVLDSYTFWNEQYLLQAFLAFNESFEVLWAGSYMHLVHPDKLEAAFVSYDRAKNWPGSFWMRRVK
ncbi:MAG TPA: class I SAM-dependent methyltransferase [Pyrinomonadaceae bacterium]|jgi:predicted O-methyltransferase YrrM|nr:class I SAM-dependent methyltransferase [Pyrinomonadaceae bacterium]